MKTVELEKTLHRVAEFFDSPTIVVGGSHRDTHLDEWPEIIQEVQESIDYTPKYQGGEQFVATFGEGVMIDSPQEKSSEG